MTRDQITSRLQALNLGKIAEYIDAPDDLPYPLPKPKVLRLLEISATQFPEKSTEIMALHQDILKGPEI